MFQYPRRIEPLVQHGEADLAEYEIQVSVSSSDRASGATPVRQLVALLLGVFQYPRRIEPLVQLNVHLDPRRLAQCFSILVGSSLWCNVSPVVVPVPVVVVSVSSSDRASGATGTRSQTSSPSCKFQYPRRIEPLVQRPTAAS